MPYKNKQERARYQRNWRAANRRDWIISQGSACVICGDDHFPALQVDHVNPALKDSHRIWSWSAARREQELRKCQVLCTFCHVDKSTRENRGRLPKWAQYR